jgi:hypothetical protein
MGRGIGIFPMWKRVKWFRPAGGRSVQAGRHGAAQTIARGLKLPKHGNEAFRYVISPRGGRQASLTHSVCASRTIGTDELI